MRELIVNADLTRGRSFRRLGDLYAALRVIMAAWDVSYAHGASPEQLLRDLTAMGHQQFPWQTQSSMQALFRYYRILRRPDMAAMVERVVGMDVRTYFLIGIIGGGELIRRPWVDVCRPLDEVNVAPELVQRFYARLTTRIAPLRHAIWAKQSFDRSWGYTWNPLEATPLLQLDRGSRQAYAPIPEFYYRAITHGLYYALVKQAAFSRAIGEAFEAYVGEVLHAAFAGPPWQVRGETPYLVGKARKHGADWVVTDGTGHLVIECKAKRLRLDAKMPGADDSFDQQLEVLAQAVVQLYKNIRDAQSGDNQAWQPNGLPVYPVVVTLDEWHLFGPIALQTLEERVVAGLGQAGIPTTMRQAMPYTVCSAEDFERGVLTVAELGLATVFGEKTQDDYKARSLHAFVMHRHPEVAARVHRDLFWDDLREIAPFEAVHGPPRQTGAPQGQVEPIRLEEPKDLVAIGQHTISRT
ncbi:hypothetical protein [Cupriavidus sp. AcVe19-6a]|uniref:hypothetical protein n=1 Tax=Cupriavidus sp. AcVe19-6a TaxID=2821358 RepID=UPI001AE5E372|nr:hypothetical protein [Cupriavidus sp. AcVe19-6a]MBP0640122.1 hypothetical protein [Cupriavidus sp. AcVe19-6a]